MNKLFPQQMKVSVIIPAFNEEESISSCLSSLLKQTHKGLEIIIVDDGSTDDTKEIIKTYTVKLLEQKHLGPGLARNLGAREARGEILVFVDADMVFDEKFIEKLVEPIIKDRVVGTFSKEEMVLNKNNVWSKCWNINKGLPTDRMHPKNYPDFQNVFRAILKDKFLLTGGFTPIGYVDDHTIADKLGIQAVAAEGAIFYHKNPETLKEIFIQARWIGKSEFKRRKIKNEILMKIVTIIRYNLLLSLVNGLYKSVQFKLPHFLIFKIVYDLAIEISIFKSFVGEQQYK